MAIASAVIPGLSKDQIKMLTLDSIDTTFYLGKQNNWEAEKVNYRSFFNLFILSSTVFDQSIRWIFNGSGNRIGKVLKAVMNNWKWKHWMKNKQWINSMFVYWILGLMKWQVFFLVKYLIRNFFFPADRNIYVVPQKVKEQ